MLITMYVTAADLRYEVHCGPISEHYLPQLKKFDKELFFEFPYLFVTTPEYEAVYWSAVSTPTTILILAYDQDTIIGAMVALSVDEKGEGHAEAVSQHAHYRPGKCINLAWIAVEKAYQRNGVANALVKVGEKVALAAGYTDAYMITVVRSQDHPLRPKTGFVFTPDIVCQRAGCQLTGIHELWQWPTRCGVPGNEYVATIDNMVQYWHKQIVE